MKIIEQFLSAAVYKSIITVDVRDKLLNLFLTNYPNSDLYKNYLSSKVIDRVFTFSEACSLYNLNSSTLNKNLEYDSYMEGEVKRSGRIWLITLNAMERLYPNKRIPINTLSYLLLAKEFITDEQITELTELLKSDFPNMDIYDDDSMNNLYNHKDNYIEEVFTFTEAAEKYHLYKTTLRKNVDYGRYENGEVRQSKGVWLITQKALKRLYGKMEDIV